jgi:hypothetical protein
MGMPHGEFDLDPMGEVPGGDGPMGGISDGAKDDDILRAVCKDWDMIKDNPEWHRFVALHLS